MIKALQTADDVTLVIVQMLKEQTGLSSEYILNGETHQGADLGFYDNISKTIVPFSTSDTFIVFDQTEDTEKSRTQVLDDDSIDCFTYYRYNLIIYGDQAGTISQKLRARLTTAKVRRSLEANGVHIETFEPINSMNEYINNVYWQRKAIEIVVSCRLNFEQASVDNSMQTFGNLQIEVNTEFADAVRATMLLERQSHIEDDTLVIDADVEVSEDGTLKLS